MVDATVNGRELSAVFDTGFSGAFACSTDIKFGEPSGYITIRDFVGATQAPVYKINSLRVGPMTFDTSDKEVVSIGESHSSWEYGTHVDGIMGLAVLQDFVFQIDMEHSRFVIYPKSHDITQEKLDGQKKFLVKMLPIGTRSIQLAVNTSDSKTMVMALDTGNAFFATTHTDVLTRLGLWRPGTEAKWVGSSEVATGPVDSFSLSLSDLQIFGVPVKKSVWDIIDLPSGSSEHDGTVGYQFLRNFNITIDMNRRMVLMENFAGRVGGDEVADTGMFAFYDSKLKHMRVVHVTSDSPAEKAGIKLGDQVLAVDGTSVGHLGISGFRRLMTGPMDSICKIQISRTGSFRTFGIKRALMVNHVQKS